MQSAKYTFHYYHTHFSQYTIFDKCFNFCICSVENYIIADPNIVSSGVATIYACMLKHTHNFPTKKNHLECRKNTMNFKLYNNKCLKSNRSRKSKVNRRNVIQIQIIIFSAMIYCVTQIFPVTEMSNIRQYWITFIIYIFSGNLASRENFKRQRADCDLDLLPGAIKAVPKCFRKFLVIYIKTFSISATYTPQKKFCTTCAIFTFFQKFCKLLAKLQKFIDKTL